MIDDFEDGDDRICANPSRAGTWYIERSPDVTTYPLAAGPVLPMPIVGGRGGSNHDMDFACLLPTLGQFALVGATLNQNGPYDGSKYHGLRFWARGADDDRVLRVDIVTDASTAVAGGGSCTPQGSQPCGDHWGAFVTPNRAWAQYSIDFATGLSQRGIGVPVAKDLTRIRAVDFRFEANGTDLGFEVFLDDVELY